jgi:predicted nucleotidyltransferase
VIERITANLEQFRADIVEHDNKTLVDRYYYSTSGPVLSNEQQASLRRKVSDKFDVSIRDVVLVGSAKLGFTVRHKPGRPALSHFADQSDIDVAIVSSGLFTEYWQHAFSYWVQKGQWDRLGEFRKYLFRGWLRPDKLPIDAEFPKSSEWFEFFRELQAGGDYGGYKIAAGIYLNEHFWEEYVGSSLSECRLSIQELT